MCESFIELHVEVQENLGAFDINQKLTRKWKVEWFKGDSAQIRQTILKSNVIRQLTEENHPFAILLLKQFDNKDVIIVIRNLTETIYTS